MGENENGPQPQDTVIEVQAEQSELREISNDLKEAKQQLRECLVAVNNPPKGDPGFMHEREAHNQNIANLIEDINREGKIPEYLNNAYQQAQKRHANLMKRAGLGPVE